MAARHSSQQLPDYYACVARDVVELCAPREGLWVDLVVSRGSVFFWENRPAGLREVHRVLRPDGRAMLGGGLGSTYPRRARREFIRRRRESVRRQGPDAVRAFKEVRSRETFRRWAEEAGLRDYRVVGEAALPEDDPNTDLGLWLIFSKEEGQA